MAQSKTLNFGPFNSAFLRGDQLHTCSGNTHKQETQTQAATASLPGLGSDILCLHVPYSSPSPPPPAHHRRDSDCFRQTRAHLQSPDTRSGGETPRLGQAALCTGGTSASALRPRCSPLVTTSCFTHFPCLYDPAGGRGTGIPLQDSCRENPMDRGTWQATVHGVAKRWTQLKRLSTHNPYMQLQNSKVLQTGHF